MRLLVKGDEVRLRGSESTETAVVQCLTSNGAYLMPTLDGYVWQPFAELELIGEREHEGGDRG